jgi:hypothetical protein
LYGQVRGGVGWNEAIKASGTRDPEVIYRAALDFFSRHPLSLFIGIAKSYRDFFAPWGRGIFPFPNQASGILLYIFGLGLTGVALVQTLRKISQPTYSLMLAGFVGICLSIPFLPPIDGGNRFYASTMAFFFLFVASPFMGLPKKEKDRDLDSAWVVPFGRGISLILITLTLVGAVLLSRMKGSPIVNIHDCPSGQKFFAAKIGSDSYIDLVSNPGEACGKVPSVCLSDFEANGEDKNRDDFYSELVSQANSTPETNRIAIYNNFLDGDHHYLFGTVDQLQPKTDDDLVIGCATKIETEHQSIYKVEKVFHP